MAFETGTTPCNNKAAIFGVIIITAERVTPINMILPSLVAIVIPGMKPYAKIPIMIPIAKPKSVGSPQEPNLLLKSLASI